MQFGTRGVRWRGVVSLTLLCAVAGCPRPETPAPPDEKPTASNPVHVHNDSTPIRFDQRTESAGLDFTYRNDEQRDHYTILESLGGGVAAVDFDRDGEVDVVAAGGGHFPDGKTIAGHPAGYFRNTGPWRFSDSTAQAHLDSPGHYSHAIAAADFDEDGFPDLLITGYQGVTLYHNQGDGTFQDITAQAGLDDSLWSSTAAWGDINADGFLDLYIAHYVDWSFENHPVCRLRNADREICPPRRFDPLPDTLYVSDGHGGFRDVSSEIGLKDGGKGLSVLIADVEPDGDSDIYVANDTVENFLYRNDDGKLTEIGLQSGAAVNAAGGPDGSMGIDIGDFNLDGAPDLWVANFESEAFALYLNVAPGIFRHHSQKTGIAALEALYVGWGTRFADFDRDGDEDLLAVNGHVIRHPTLAPLRQRPLLLENQAGRRIRNVADLAGPYFTEPHMARGLATADFDHDGRLDLVISHTNEPVALLANTTEDANPWIGFELIGRIGNRDALGARVELVAGDRTFQRQRVGGGSYASTHESRLLFGLGSYAEPVDVTIHWPSGVKQKIESLEPNRYHRILEPLAPGRS